MIVYLILLTCPYSYSFPTRNIEILGIPAFGALLIKYPQKLTSVKPMQIL